MNKKESEKFDSVDKLIVEAKDKVKQDVKTISYEEVRQILKKLEPRFEKYFRELS